MMNGLGGIWGFGGLGMVIGMLLWLGVIVALVWGAFALFPTNRKGADHAESAMEILKRRYASGEITQAEFEQAKKALQ